MKIYFKIWVDLIIRACSIPANKKNWKRLKMTFMSMAMALNFMLFMAILQRNILRFSFYDFKVDIFHGTKLDAFISGFVLYLLPMLLINYFLIFWNNRYEILLKKYKSYNGRLFFVYFFTSLGVPLIIFILIFISKS
jgi:hypothetical protein